MTPLLWGRKYEELYSNFYYTNDFVKVCEKCLQVDIDTDSNTVTQHRHSKRWSRCLVLQWFITITRTVPWKRDTACLILRKQLTYNWQQLTWLFLICFQLYIKKIDQGMSKPVYFLWYVSCFQYQVSCSEVSSNISSLYSRTAHL